ncbi:DNA recombination protein RmuC [Sphingomonas jatrophae]|uniref:DNA recombination protein RmuC homolog n=1 Tax=Sphingomonas jatrophae TaxID=1166337 RepID=A0A1I6M0P3_9SPHN|nr:DNA recombination protein RmuC [Sphingomonas jatrophae]SFS09270.1 DNA recombination protein RmuC [Sphingomonas jatrophae]
MDAWALLLILVALAGGLVLGWMAAARGAATLRAERDGWQEKATRALAELAGASIRGAQADTLEARVIAAEEARHAAERRLAALESGLEERERAFAAQLDERDRLHAAQVAGLQDMEARLQERFGLLAGQALETAQTRFLARADERLGQQAERSEGQLKALLTPVQDTLKRYDEKLGEIERARVGSYEGLREAVTQLAQGNEVVRRETARLTNVLRSSPKARGRWGEEQLRNILEQAGLAENVDFSLQTTVADGDRQLRPDCVIHLPGGRSIVVDVKCPLVHFEAAYDEEDEGVRAGLLLQHANALKAYANDLGRKAYWKQFDRAPDFVIMFVPGEHFLAAAAERAPDLIEAGFRQGVILASTINMLALAKVMAGMWRQEALAAQAQEVAEAGKELYRRLATMGGHVTKLGRNLEQAAGAYNQMIGSLESQVLTQARRFEALKVDTGGRTLDPLAPVETAVRPLTRLSTAAAE